MRFLYIAEHGQPNNNDEGAISKALFSMGHKVDLFQLGNFETDKIILNAMSPDDYDIVLFHKLSAAYIEYISNKWKSVCWFFDAVNKGFVGNDDYAEFVKEHVYMGFFTDGDFVRKVKQANIIELKQGFDEPDTPPVENKERKNNIVFLGNYYVSATHGAYNERSYYLHVVNETYPKDLIIYRYSIFKEQLTAICQDSKIMLAMPPVTDHYWSNRIYLLGGRGAFVLHPYSKGLEEQFGTDIVFYHDHEDLLKQIDFYLKNDDKRYEIASNMQRKVIDNYCYHHRCRDLIREIEDYERKK